MSKLIKNPVDQGIVESAEKIPVSHQVRNEDLTTAQQVALSHHLPSVKVTDTQSAHAFLEDDGGY